MIRPLRILIVFLAANLSVAAQAATVASGATAVGDTAGITAVSGTTVRAWHHSYFNDPTPIPSDWVWVDDRSDVNSARFEFAFDLTGYDASSAVLSGLWGVDNTGTVRLNGLLLATLGTVSRGNFGTLHAYGASSGFLDGLNVLSFDLQDRGYIAGFRATAVVEADLAPVPLPAGVVLGLTAFGALWGLRRRG